MLPYGVPIYLIKTLGHGINSPYRHATLDLAIPSLTSVYLHPLPQLSFFSLDLRTVLDIKDTPIDKESETQPLGKDTVTGIIGTTSKHVSMETW